jgi:hypothetical protein
MISSAAWALRMLAFLADAAWLAVTANAAGSLPCHGLFAQLGVAEGLAMVGVPAQLAAAYLCLDVPFAFDALGEPGVSDTAGQDPPASLAADMHGALRPSPAASSTPSGSSGSSGRSTCCRREAANTTPLTWPRAIPC